MRALGNIFHVLPKEWIQSEVEGLVKDIIHVLIKSINSGPVKVSICRLSARHDGMLVMPLQIF